MSDLLELMAVPFAACVVLVGIHAYLGLHVIQRRVIFVDLALAQIAALGATFSFLLGLDPHGRGAYFFALGFAIVGAAVFSLTRMRHERVPQEAIIGIVYAVALATAILVADRAPEGAEHIKETMVGAILWVTWPTVLKTAVIYALVGALHVVFRKRFLQISFHPDQAYAEGRWVRLWDFVFYMTFAFVITSSVAIAGVLMVFTFLVIPAVIATLFSSRISVRLGVGWTVGIVACLAGMVASYRFDMPSGPTVVSALGMALVLAGLLYYIVSADRRHHAALKVAAGIAIAVGLVAGAVVFATGHGYLRIEHEHDWELEPAEGPGEASPWDEMTNECGADGDCLAARLAGRPDWPELIAEQFAGTHDERERAVDLVVRLGKPEGLDLLADAAAAEADPLFRLREARALAAAGDTRGLTLAVDLLGPETPPLVRDDAAQLLIESSGGEDFGYDAFAGDADNIAAVARWREWVRTYRP